jgi:hypothetical protein
MKRQLLLLALLVAPAWMPQASLQASPVQRCTNASGVVYTDGACRALGATPAPMSAELIRNLAREARVLDAGNTFLGDQFAPVSTASSLEAESARAYLAARHGGASCARTPEQLQLLLRGSVSMGDVNRIATAYDWAGMGSGQARQVLTRLEGLAKSPVTSTNYYNGSITSGAIVDATVVADATPGAGFLQLVQDGGTQVTEFEVHRQAGCYFVSF